MGPKSFGSPGWCLYGKSQCLSKPKSAKIIAIMKNRQPSGDHYSQTSSSTNWCQFQTTNHRNYSGSIDDSLDI